MVNVKGQLISKKKLLRAKSSWLISIIEHIFDICKQKHCLNKQYFYSLRQSKALA